MDTCDFGEDKRTQLQTLKPLKQMVYFTSIAHLIKIYVLVLEHYTAYRHT